MSLVDLLNALVVFIPPTRILCSVFLCLKVGHAAMLKTKAKKKEDEYDFVFEDTIDFVSQEVLQQKLT